MLDTDTLEERYRKVKRAGESFLVTQFGLSTVHVDDAQQFSIKTWNFYIFPRPYGTSDERFLCQASSLQFLSEHGFDFNKFIGEGIPFINLSKTEQLRQRLEKRIENIAKPNKNLSLSDDGLAFQEDVKERLSEWLEKGNGRNGTVLTIPARNSFFKMIIHETVRAKANYLYSESKDDTVQVRVVSNKVKEELLAAKAQEVHGLVRLIWTATVTDVVYWRYGIDARRTGGFDRLLQGH
jgi:poly(A)-specific ribonuclease